MKEGWRVRFQVSGLNVEKALNAARSRGIPLEAVARKKNRALSVTASPGAYRAFRALAEEKGYQVSPARPVGLLFLFGRLEKRRGLLLGGALALGLIIFALGFIWQVRVENAGAYEGEVRAYLEELGVRPGARRSAVRLGDLRDKLEWRLPKVKWVRVEWAGVALRVRLEEGVPPPDAESAAPADLVASEDGVIKRLTTYAGTPQVKPGDLVRAGQVLIKGEEKGENGETTPVRARGEAIARVWYTARARLPLTEYASLPTGRKTEKRTVFTPFFSFARASTPAYLTADLDRRTQKLIGAWFPVWLVRETWEEVELKKMERSLEEVKKEGEKAACLALNRALIGDEIVDKWLNFSMIEGDNIVVTATAEILRDIGRSAP